MTVSSDRTTAGSDQYAWLDRVVVHPLNDGSGRSILGDRHGGLIRVNGAISTLVTQAKAVRSQQPEGGPFDLDEVSDQLGAEWPVEKIGATLAAIERSAPRLLTVTDVGPTKIIEFSPPFIVRFALFDPSKLLTPRSPVVRALATRGFWICVAVLCGIGVVGSIDLATSGQSPLNQTMPTWAYLVTFAAVYSTVVLHELMHAATLIAHGGRSRRMGFMIFYLLPAFFCEVNDAWRLPPRKRVLVAMAGIASQGALAGIGMLVLPFLPGYWQTMVGAFVVLMILYGVTNLVPLVKLDGYVALAGALDLPNLRQKSIETARVWFARRLVGISTRPPLTQRWAVPFGIASGLAPIAMLIAAVQLIGSYLWSFGRVAPIVQSIAIIGLLLLGLGVLGRQALRLRQEGARWTRITLGFVLPIMIIAFVVAACPVPSSQRSGFVRSDGRAELILGPGNLQPTTGTKITLTDVGYGRPAAIGTARVAAGGSFPCQVPMSAVVPVDATPGQTMPARCVALEVDGDLSSRATAGGARFWVVRSMIGRAGTVAAAAIGRQ